MEDEFNLSDWIVGYDDDDVDIINAKKVKEFVKRRIYESTKLLALFNQDKLTSMDLKEHRQRIKDEAGSELNNTPKEK